MSSSDDLEKLRNCITVLEEQVKQLRPITDKPAFDKDVFARELADVQSALLDCENALMRSSLEPPT